MAKELKLIFQSKKKIVVKVREGVKKVDFFRQNVKMFSMPGSYLALPHRFVLGDLPFQFLVVIIISFF